MKLPAQWKYFYIRCLDIPFIGRFVIGPYLRFLWRIIALFGKNRQPLPLNNDRITTYASTIDSLRRQIESMDQRVQRVEQLQREAEESALSTSLLLASALEGLARRLSQQEDTAAFQQLLEESAHSTSLLLASALEGLARRLSQQEDTAAFQQLLEESAHSTSLLLASALEGLARRLSQQEDTAAFQQLLTGAALGALCIKR